MSFSKISALGGLIAFASSVAAHGTVTGIVADGVYYEGYHANFQYLQTEPVVVGWSTPEDLSNGFIAPSAYDSPDIICHLGATNAMTSASVKAGGTVEMQWTPWPTSHHGPVIDYLAKCANDDCTTVDKTTLEFFKIDGQGLISDTTIPGNWASDSLIANNNSWTVTIPTDIAPGNYVLRHEIIALHSAENADGAQNYPFCFNLAIASSGTATPAGTLGTDLYHETDPGILVDIYNTLSTYIVPGPTLYSGAVSVSQTAQPSATVVASAGSATSAAASTTAISAVVTPTLTSTFLPSASGVIPKYNSTQGAPYLNSSTISTSKSKSACKVRPTSTTVLPAAATTTALSATAIATQTSSPTSTTEILIQTPTAAPSSTSITPPSLPTFTTSPTVSTSAPTSTSTVPEIPEGTTLNTLLSWLAAFYNKFAGTEYDADTVAVVSRRHARDLNALV